MNEKRVAVRMHADGGGQIRAEFTGIGTAGDAAFDKITRSTKSAEASAQVFERQLEAQKRQVDALRASVDPAFASMMRFEKAQTQLSQAVKVGLYSQGEADLVLKRLAGSLDDVDRAGGLSTNTMRQVAFQFSQVGQQGAATGDLMGALAIQLPDILGSFGGLPFVLAGVAAGFGATLIPALIQTEEEALSAEAAVDALGGAVGRLQAATSSTGEFSAAAAREYGRLSREAQAVFEIEREIARFRATEAFNRAATSLATELGTGAAFGLDPQAVLVAEASARAIQQQIDALERESTMVSDEILRARLERIDALRIERLQLREVARGMDDLADVLGVTEAAAANIASKFAEVAQSEAGEAQARAMQDLASYIFEASDGLVDAEEEGRDLYDRLVQAAIEALKISKIDVGAGIGEAADEATRLNSEIERVQAAAVRAAGAMNQLRGAGLSELETLRIRQQHQGDPVATAGALAAARFDRETSDLVSGGFGEGGEEAQYYAQRDAVIREAEEAARIRQSLLPPTRTPPPGGGGGGMSDTERRFLEMEREATRIAQSVMTDQERYNEELARANELLDEGLLSYETYTRHVDALAAAMEEVSEQERKMAEVSLQASDAIIDSLMGQERAAERLTETLKRSLYEYVLFGRGLFAPEGNQFNGILGGVFSGLVSFDGGGYTGAGPRSGGMDGRGGFLAMLHPQETVVDHTKSGGGGGSAEIVVALSPDLEARLVRRAAEQTVRIVQANSDALVQGTPDVVRAYDQRGTL